MKTSTFYKISLILIGLAAFLFAETVHAEVRYTIVDLGTLGGDYTYAYDINNSNQVDNYQFC